MRKSVHEPLDKEDISNIQKIVDKRNSKYRPNESYIRTSKEITIIEPYNKIKNNVTEQ
jgi:hypothetical protein